MQVTIRDREVSLRDRLRERLSRVESLRCTEHGQPVTAVSIHARENGWFDAWWTTCCESLEREAAKIVKDRL